MASKSIGSLYAEITLRDKNFTTRLKEARKGLNDFGKSTMKYAGVALGAAATGIGAGLAAGTLRTLDQVDALKDLSDQTGIAIDDAAVLGRAYKDGGRDAEMLGKDIGKMQKALVEASSGGNDPFAAIGLSASELMQMNPAQQFQQIGDAIMRIQNPAERTAKAMEIFGKGGMGLTTVFPGMEGAVKAMGKMPQLAKEFGAAMGEANDLIGHLPLKSDQFFMGFTSGIIGTLLPNLRKIDEYDFTQLGQNLGQSLATGFEMLKDGSLWEIFQLQGQKAIAAINSSPALNSFYAGLLSVWEGITDGQGFDWDKSFEKYTQAGIMANTELIDDLQARIDELVANGKNKVSASNSSVSNQANNPIAAPLVDIFKPTDSGSEIKGPERATFQSSFTDYQRRGLSSGIAPISENKVQKQIDLLQGIKDILKQATLDGAVLKF
jgi:hypothetical protein